MKKLTKKEQEQATKAREDEMARQRFALENAFDHELRALASRVIMLHKGADAHLFAERASLAFDAAAQECARFLPKAR
jgi:hypothetical protein